MSAVELTRNERIARLLGYFVVDRDGDPCPGLLVPRQGAGWHRYAWGTIEQRVYGPVTVVGYDLPDFEGDWSAAWRLRVWAAADDVRWHAWTALFDWRTTTPAELCDAALRVAERETA